MSSQPPPERETPIGNSDRVEQFLAKLGPIIAAHRGLTPNCRRQLTDIARNLGLTDQQMTLTLRSYQTGSEPETSERSPDNPPPDDARRQPAAEQADTPAGNSDNTPSAKSNSVPGKVADSGIQTRRASSASQAAVSENGEPQPATQAKRGKRPPPLPKRFKPATTEAATQKAEAEPVEPQATETGSLAAESDAKTPAAAETSALEPRPPEPRPPEPPPPAATAPVPPPPEPAGPKPREAFCSELRKAFEKVGKGGALSDKAEQKLARSGQTVFGLAEVYARHLVYEVAAECGVPVVSQIQRMRKQKQESGGDGHDVKIQKFLERAAPIIAEQRGINLRSRVKMGAVARELGLSDDDMEQALKSLQRGGNTPEKRIDLLIEREHAFRKDLKRRLKKRAAGILTFADESRHIETGVDRFGVTAAFVRETLHALTAEHKIRYVSAKQAQEHVARLVDESIGASQRILPNERRLLHREGGQWGLSPDDVDDIIREKHIEFDYVSRSRQTRKLVLLATAGVLVVGLVGGLGTMMLLRAMTFAPPDDTDTARVEPDNPDETPNGTGQSDPGRPAEGPPTWWDGDLSVDASQTENFSPNCADLIKQAYSEDPELRGQAYEELVRRAPGPPVGGLAELDAEQLTRRKYFDGVLIGCYALDPSDEAAARLRDALLALVPPPHSELSEDATVLGRAFWAVEIATAALDRDNIGVTRAADMVRAIGNTVGTTLEVSDEWGRARQAGLTALCTHLYGVLAAAAPAQPNLALALHAVLTLEAARHLEPRIRESLDTDLLVAILPVIGDAWDDCRDLIESCLASRDALNVLKIVDTYERLENKDLQNFLTKSLLNIITDPPEGLPVAAVAKAVRQALGATAPRGPATAAERWAILQKKADEALADLKAPPEEPDKLLSEVIRLQYASTLGCALAQQELGFPAFDEVNERKLESLLGAGVGPTSVTSKSHLRPDGRRPPVSTRNVATALKRRLDQYVAVLRNFRNSNSVIRFRNVQGLATMTRTVPQIDPRNGADIATYLLLAKPVPEHKQILPYVKDLAKWRYVRIGLADAIDPPPTRKPRRELVQDVLSATLGHAVVIDDYDNWDAWTPRMRRALLISMVDQLAGESGPAASASALYDRGSNLLHDYYTIQARLVGVLPAKYMSTDIPSAVLKLLVDQYAAKLSGRVKRPNDREYLDELPYHLTAAEYVGHDDMRYTLMLERIWLRLLAAAVAAEHPDRAEKADQLVSELALRDGKTKHVLTQMRDGHETMLRMWLLTCEP